MQDKRKPALLTRAGKLMAMNASKEVQRSRTRLEYASQHTCKSLKKQGVAGKHGSHIVTGH